SAFAHGCGGAEDRAVRTVADVLVGRELVVLALQLVAVITDLRGAVIAVLRFLVTVVPGSRIVRPLKDVDVRHPPLTAVRVLTNTRQTLAQAAVLLLAANQQAPSRQPPQGIQAIVNAMCSAHLVEA